MNENRVFFYRTIKTCSMHYVKVYTSQVYSTFLSGNLLKKILLLKLHKCAYIPKLLLILEKNVQLSITQKLHKIIQSDYFVRSCANLNSKWKVVSYNFTTNCPHFGLGNHTFFKSQNLEKPV